MEASALIVSASARPEVVTARQARRLLMAGHLLLVEPARCSSSAAVRKVIERLGFVQVDTINVLVRAHEHILQTRLDGFQPGMLRTLLERDRSLFEHWTHDASIIPRSFLRQWKHRFDWYSRTGGRNPWWRDRMGRDARRVIDHVLDRIQREGPLMSRDFEHDRVSKPRTWWSWKPQKAALEYLWRCGELAVSHRVGFQKAYDLTHRVFDEFRGLSAATRVEHVDWACGEAMQRLVVATPSELAAFFAGVDLAEARCWCSQQAERGQLVRVVVETTGEAASRPAYALAEWRRISDELPEPAEHVRLLSPFDPLIRDRRRVKRLFAFDYRFEAFVPAAKRTYGYYTVPMLHGDRLVGRLDAHVDRSRGKLVVGHVWWEPGISVNSVMRSRLREAVERMAKFVGMEQVCLQM